MAEVESGAKARIAGLARDEVRPHMPDSFDGTSFEGTGVSRDRLDERKRFTRFEASDAALLVELRPVFEAHAESIVDRFYEHLLGFDALSPLLGDAESMRRLRRFQREYLGQLVCGAYEEPYAQRRLAIGRVHARIGLEPQWYLGTYGLYLELLLPLVHEHFAGDPDRAVRASTALSKLLLLDMQLVLDAYHGVRHQRALAKSEQLAAVGELAASIAHEVRNPLAGMKGALEVLRKELAVKPGNLEIVDELLAQINRLGRLVRDLLTFARPRTPEPVEFDLQEMLDRLIRLQVPEADRLGVTVERVYGPGTARMIADAMQIEQVLLNLIHNALQAMEDGGTLAIVTRSAGGSIVVTLRDDGKGIAPRDLDRVLQPFFTTKHRGSGLGLPIVKKIAEAHGGTIELASEPGVGTTVSLTLPQRETAHPDAPR